MFAATYDTAHLRQKAQLVKRPGQDVSQLNYSQHNYSQHEKLNLNILRFIYY